jgi:hypothetical protein
MIPIIVGLFLIGTAPARIFNAPFSMPDDPIPAIARPTMSILEELATPQIKEPTSNMLKKERNILFDEK